MQEEKDHLNAYLADLATDPGKLAAFLLDPEASMSEERLSKKDQVILKSNFPYMVGARMSGYPLKAALTLPVPPVPPVWKPGRPRHNPPPGKKPPSAAK